MDVHRIAVEVKDLLKNTRKTANPKWKYFKVTGLYISNRNLYLKYFNKVGISVFKCTYYTFIHTHLSKTRTDKHKVYGAESHLRDAQKQIDQELARGRPATRHLRTALEAHFDRFGEIGILDVAVLVLEQLRAVQLYAKDFKSRGGGYWGDIFYFVNSVIKSTLTSMCWLCTQTIPIRSVSSGASKRPPFLKASPIANTPDPTLPLRMCISVSRKLQVI